MIFFWTFNLGDNCDDFLSEPEYQIEFFVKSCQQLGVTLMSRAVSCKLQLKNWSVLKNENL